MKKSILAAFILCLFWIGGQPAYACECVHTALTAWGELQASDAVFTGAVVGVREVQTPVKPGAYTLELEVKFEVERALKGVKDKEVVLRTSPGLGGDCGIGFKKGEKYLVYAYSHGGGWRTNSCTRTKPLEYAAADFKEMEEGVELKTEAGKIIESIP